MKRKKLNEYFASFNFGGISLGMRPLEDNQVIGLVGMPGTGKTCLATKILLREQKRGRVIFTNDDYINDFADYTFTPQNLGKWNFDDVPSVVFIDEMSLNGYDCRDNKNFANKELLDFWKKHRQEGVPIVWTNQAYSETDIKVRDFLTSSVYLCERTAFGCRATKIHKTEKLNLETGRIDYQFYTEPWYIALFVRGERIFANPRKYGKHYKSVHPTPKKAFNDALERGLFKVNEKTL